MKNIFKTNVYVKPVDDLWGVYQMNMVESFLDDLRFGLQIALSNFWVSLKEK
jgi:hypothetical protein